MLKYKVVVQAIIAMLTEDKVIKLFCMGNVFYKFYDAMM